MNRLLTFGPANFEINIEGSGGGGRGTTRGSSGGTSREMPEGLGGGRGDTRRTTWNRSEGAWERLLSALNPIANAWATSVKAVQEFELFYAAEWERFVQQYGEYVEGLRKDDEANAREAAQLIATRKELVTPDTYTVIDPETLTAIEMFLSELEQETEFLLEGQRARQFQIPNDALTHIQEARRNALKAQDLWAEAQVMAVKLRPKSYEEDEALWWGFLPEILLQ